mmetsp:Transcript_32263/g.52287  ORF Transcript_32263/g.52287 Transcript_32263/m.52287 type:complete len:81 (-) Transcript_32263:44-286(-)
MCMCMWLVRVSVCVLMMRRRVDDFQIMAMPYLSPVETQVIAAAFFVVCTFRLFLYRRRRILLYFLPLLFNSECTINQPIV